MHCIDMLRFLETQQQNTTQHNTTQHNTTQHNMLAVVGNSNSGKKTLIKLCSFISDCCVVLCDVEEALLLSAVKKKRTVLVLDVLCSDEVVSKVGRIFSSSSEGGMEDGLDDTTQHNTTQHNTNGLLCVVLAVTPTRFRKLQKLFPTMINKMIIQYIQDYTHSELVEIALQLIQHNTTQHTTTKTLLTPNTPQPTPNTPQPTPNKTQTRNTQNTHTMCCVDVAVRLCWNTTQHNTTQHVGNLVELKFYHSPYSQRHYTTHHADSIVCVVLCCVDVEELVLLSCKEKEQFWCWMCCVLMRLCERAIIFSSSSEGGMEDGLDDTTQHNTTTQHKWFVVCCVGSYSNSVWKTMEITVSYND